MPSGCVPGRQARSKSASVPGLIWRVVIQTKCSSIVASSDRRAGIDAGDNRSSEYFLCPRCRGRPPRVDPQDCPRRNGEQHNGNALAAA
jgi:hypothetical protein